MAKVHKFKNFNRRFAYSSVCPICVVEYSTRPRLLRHLNRPKNNFCVPLLHKYFVPMTVEQSEQLDAIDLPNIKKLIRKGLPKWYSDIPNHRVCGPPLAISKNGVANGILSMPY